MAKHLKDSEPDRGLTARRMASDDWPFAPDPQHLAAPALLDSYNDDLDVDDVANAPTAPVGIAAHLGMRPGPTLPSKRTRPSGLSS